MAARNSSAVAAFSTRGMVSMRAASQSMDLPSGGATIQGWKNLTTPQTRQSDSRRAIWVAVRDGSAAGSGETTPGNSTKISRSTGKMPVAHGGVGDPRRTSRALLDEPAVGSHGESVRMATALKEEKRIESPRRVLC